MKKLVTSYTFDASLKTIDSADFTSLEKILLITNVTDGIIIYNFADAAKGGTLAGTVLTLDHDTTAMDDTDKLQIFVDVGTSVGNGTTDTGTQRVSISSDSTGLVFSKLKDASGNNTSVQTPGDAMAAAPTTALGTAAFNLVYNGTNYVRQRGDATDGTLVNLGANNDVTVTSGAITETNSAAIKTAVETIDNAIAGTEMQVDVVAALPAGTNNIGDVDVATLPVAFDTGVRSATTQRVTIATDDLVPVSLASVPSHAVTNAGTFAVQAATAGDVAAGSADSGNPVKIGGKYNATQPTLTDGQRGNLELNSRGELKVSIVSAGQAANTTAAFADASTNTTGAVNVGAYNKVWNGSTWDRMPGDTTGISVKSHPVTNAGTFATQATTSGDVAHDTADSGAPQKVGGQARTTNPTAVADADRTNFIADKLGKQVVVGSIRDLKGDQTTTITSSTTETTIVTGAASTFHDLYGLIVVNTSATACEVSFRDVTAGSVRFPLYVPAGDTRGFMLNESAAFKQATVNTAWTAQCGTSVASIKITALYVKNT